MQMLKHKPVKVLILEILNEDGAAHYREIILRVQSVRKNIPEHSVRARLSEGVLKKELARLEEGVYDIYSENEDLTSVVSYPYRGPWGDYGYRGNCSGFLAKDLILRFHPSKVFDPMEGSKTVRHVVEGLNRMKGLDIAYDGKDLRSGFNLLTDEINGHYDLIFFHPPYHDMIRNSGKKEDLSNCANYSEFVEKLRICVEKLHNALAEDGVLAILIGDKRKDGKYTPIFNDILNFKIGELKSIIVKAQHNVCSSKKRYSFSREAGRRLTIPIMHEYCLLFQKK